MNESQQSINRREWFRLAAPRQNRPMRQPESTPISSMETTGDEHSNRSSDCHFVGNAIDSSQLKPISKPENLAGMNLNDLPPMREAFLSIDQVASLFQDIQDLATDV